MNLHPVKDPLVWIDLEMTGLDVQNDCILEVACIITDGDLNEVAENVHLVIHKDKDVLERMNEWCQVNHRKNGLYDDVLRSTTTTQRAEMQLIQFIKKYIPTPKYGVLAGNSVHMDKMFLLKEMPTITEHLHYRLVDASTIKELARRWCSSDVLDGMPGKTGTHRALDDIRESIRELKWYRANIFRV